MLRTIRQKIGKRWNAFKVAYANYSVLVDYFGSSEKGKSKVLVILNLSANPQPIQIKDNTLLGKPYNIFMGDFEELKNTTWDMEPWGYQVYEYK